MIEDSQQAITGPEPIVAPPAGASPRPALVASVPILTAPDAPNSQQAEERPEPQVAPPAGASTARAELEPGPVVHTLAQFYSRPAERAPAPLEPPSGVSTSSQAEGTSSTGDTAPALKRRPTKRSPASTVVSSDGETSPAANVESAPVLAPPQGGSSDRHSGGDTHPAHAVGEEGGPAAVGHAASNQRTLLDPILGFAAEVLDDMEKVRIATGNRLSILTRSEADSDGETRGFGLSEAHPDVTRMAEVMLSVKALEDSAVKNLQRIMRKHPLGPWVQAQRGIGLKQGARLLAAIGDPYINSAKGAPRTVSALWAYSGLHVVPASHSSSDDPIHAAGGDEDTLGGQPQLGSLSRIVPEGQARCGPHNGPALGEQVSGQNGIDDQTSTVGVAPRRRKGVRANWSGRAKMRAHLVAESCVKQLAKPCVTNVHVKEECKCSPYRLKYEERRRHTAITHPDWTDGHSHNDALRITSKEVLKQLWRAARAWHEEQQRELG